LRQIKREFEVNGLLRDLYPDILWAKPDSEAPKWSEDEGIVVKRKVNPKESTVEAWGLVDGQPTGRHFSRMIYDDVVTLESVTTPEMCAKTIRAWEMSRNLMSEGGKTRYIGTRYHFNDAYGEIMRREVVKPRIFAVYAPDGTPRLLSKERIEEKRRELGPYVFSSQMLQNPCADEAQNFKEEWLQIWSVETTKNLRVYIVVDPASKKKKNSDYTAMFVVGLGLDKNYYILDMIRDRLNLTERMQTLFGLHRMYQPIAVGYEEYGMQSDIEHIQYVMNQENYHFPIYPLGGNVGKEDRIRALVPVFEQKRVFIPSMCIRPRSDGKVVDLTKVFIEEEYKTFPVGAHDDMLDALARILDHGKKGLFATFPDGPIEIQISRPPANITEVKNLEIAAIMEDVKRAEEARLELYDY
jgi:predicted phage terminase large subunit-like protein